MELSSISALGKVALSLFEKYSDSCLDEALEKAAAGGVSLDEIRSSDKRMAAFVRYLKAFEGGSSEAVIQLMTAALLEGFSSKLVDVKSEIIQMIITRLGELTEVEAVVLSEMFRLNILRDDSEQGHIQSRHLESVLCEKYELGSGVAEGVVSGIARTGFVVVRYLPWADVPPNYYLSELGLYVKSILWHRMESEVVFKGSD